jgi:hypothetical protein
MQTLAQGAIPILIFSIQSGLYAQFPVIRAVVKRFLTRREAVQVVRGGSVP